MLDPEEIQRDRRAQEEGQPHARSIEKKESIRRLENLKQSTELLDDPRRCVHIGDRESDIYELFCAAQEVGTHFLVRTCVDRLAGDGDHTIADEMAEVAVKGLPRVEVRDRNGNPDEAALEIRYRRIRVLPPTLQPSMVLRPAIRSANLDRYSRKSEGTFAEFAIVIRNGSRTALRSSPPMLPFRASRFRPCQAGAPSDGRRAS